MSDILDQKNNPLRPFQPEMYPGLVPPLMPPIEAPAKAKRGGRRTPVANNDKPQPARKPVRAPTRRAAPAKRPRRSEIRRPRRPKGTADTAGMVNLFAQLQPGDGALWATVHDALQEAPTAQRKRILALLPQVFAEG